MALANLLIKIGADISELRTGTDKAVATMEKTGAKIDSIGTSIKSTLLGAFSVGAVVSFGKELLRMGDDIVRTADRTGLLTDEVQKLSFIASQSGNSLEEVTSALGQMQNRLASGDKSALSGVKSLGLSFEELRRQNPFEQFTSIAEAIGKIPNPATRAQVAMDLFGRSGIAILPTLTANVTALGNAVPLMSEKTVRALDKAGDQFDQLLLTIKVWAAESYNFAGRAFDSIVAAGMRLIAGFADVTAGMLELAQKIPGSSKVFPDLADKIKKTREEAEWYRDAAKGLTAKTVEAGAAVRKVVPAFDLVGDAVDKASAAHKRAKPPVDAHAAALKKTTEAAEAFSMDLTNNMIPVVAQLGTEIAIVTPTVEAFSMVLTDDMIPKAVARLGTEIDIVIPKVEHLASLGETLTQSLGTAFTKIPDLLMQAFTGGGGISGAMKAIGVSMADAIMRPIMVGLTKVQQAAVGTGSSIATAFGGLAGGGTGAKIAGIAAGLGGAALAASSWGVAMTGAGLAGTVALGAATLGIGAAAVGVAILVKKLTDSKGRDAVKKFAESFGGFDPLHKKLSDLGASGEALWVKLTQGVGSNNPKQAQAAIDEITAALNKQGAQTQALSSIMEEYGFTWEDLGEKARGAKLAELFDTLFEKTQILKDAGIDYSEILKRQSTDYSLLVQAAVRTGAEIPIAMQPILQELIDMGTLVDANGEAFKDLGDVSFAKTLTQGFDSVTTAIYALTDALTNGVGGALDKLGQKKITIPIGFDVEDMPGGGDVPGFAGGTHGRLLNFGSGTLAMLHGRERVMTEGESLGVSGGGDNYFVLNAGELWDQRVTKVTRQDAARGGLKPRAAHGRSY